MSLCIIESVDSISRDDSNTGSIYPKSHRTSNYRHHRNHAAHFGGWVPLNTILKIMLHCKGSAKLHFLFFLKAAWM